MNKLNATNKGILAVIIGSIFLGSIGIFVRMADSSLLPMTQSFGRIFTAFIVITIFNILRKEIKSETFKISKKDMSLFILNGLVGFSLMAAAFTLSVLHTTITNAYFLLYTAPVFAAVFSVIFLKEKLRSYIYTSILISIVGLFFLFNPTNLTQNLNGNLFGLLTGISFGSYFVITSQLGKRYSSSTITFWTQLFGSLGLFPLIFVFDKPTNISISLTDWMPVILAGIIVFFGYWLLNYGLTKIKATTGSVLSLFEPLSAIVYGIIFFSESLSSNTIVGACLVLTSIIYLTYKQKA
jgi:drug/metabolite transporter (DMT)-like permease